jgi:trimeric autotransporter adhesin
MSYKRISPLPTAEGGTNTIATPPTNGIIYFNGSSYTGLANGTLGFVLTATSGAPSWAASSGGGGTVTGVLGTTNQIASSGGTTPVISLPSTVLAPGTLESTTTLTAGNGFNVLAGAITLSPLSTSGYVINSGIGTITTASTTNHAVQVGNGAGQFTSLPVATNGQLLLGSSAANPSWVSATVGAGLSLVANASTFAYALTIPVSIANGGTNTVTAPSTNAVLYFDGTRYVGLANGTTSQVLTATTGSAPSWATPSGGSGVPSISGTSGQIVETGSPGATTLSLPTVLVAPGSIEAVNGITSDTIFNTSTPTTSTTGQYQIDGVIALMNPGNTSDNWCLAGAGNPTMGGAGNVFIGAGTAASASSVTFSTIVGHNAAPSMTTGNSNLILGRNSGFQLNGGNFNTILSCEFGGYLLTNGSGNCYIHQSSGGNQPASGSEANTLRIGDFSGNELINQAFIAGIYGVSQGGTIQTVTINSLGQLGSTTSAGIVGTANEVVVTGNVISTPTAFIAPGSVTATTFFDTATASSSTAGHYRIAGNPVLQTFGTNNTFVGTNAGNFTTSATNNVCVGANAGSSLASATGHCVYVGYNAGAVDSLGDTNVGVGNVVLSNFTGILNARNTALGGGALFGLINGMRNTAIGYGAGNGYTGSEDDNIILGNNIPGVAGESNILRIGNTTGASGAGAVAKAFVCGINGITVTGTSVLVSSTNQLGIAVSSRRFKENIEPMFDYSSRIYDLKPVTFNYKEGDDKSTQSGLIAEDVHDVMPELVVHDALGLPQTVKYHDLPALLLNEIQKLKKQVDSLMASR